MFTKAMWIHCFTCVLFQGLQAVIRVTTFRKEWWFGNFKFKLVILHSFWRIEQNRKTSRIKPPLILLSATKNTSSCPQIHWTTPRKTYELRKVWLTFLSDNEFLCLLFRTWFLTFWLFRHLTRDCDFKRKYIHSRYSQRIKYWFNGLKLSHQWFLKNYNGSFISWNQNV